MPRNPMWSPPAGGKLEMIAGVRAWRDLYGRLHLPPLAGAQPDPPPPPAGQPPANEQPPPENPPPANQPPENPPPPERPAPSQADLDKAYEKLRAAEAERDHLAKEKQERERAELGEKERAEAERDEAQAEVDRLKAEVRKARLIAELAKPEHGIVDPDLAADLIDVEYDDQGRPKDIKAAVEKLLEQRSYLKVQAPPPPPGSPGNPASGRPRGGTMTTEDVRKLARENPAEFNRMYEAGEIPASALGG